MKRFLYIPALLILIIGMSNVQATTILWGDTLESKLDALNQNVEQNLWGTRMDATEDQVTTVIDEISVIDDVYASRLDEIEAKTDDLLLGVNVDPGSVYTFNSPGLYVLIDIANATSFNVSSDNVTFDMNYYPVDFNQFQINAYDNITIKNGQITNFGYMRVNAGASRLLLDNITMFIGRSIVIRGDNLRVNNCSIRCRSDYSNLIINQATNVVVSNCWIGGGDGLGHGISITDSSNVLIEDCIIWGHPSGHGVYIGSSCSNVTIKNCIIRAPGSTYQAILDEVPAGSDQSTVIGNFAYDSPDDVRFSLLATNTEQGVALSYPPQDQQTNMWVNYYVAT